MTNPPCRLFVIMARDEPLAVILRRGPSDWYQIIQWQTRRDVFTDGAWFKGRIYEEKCDLSPDGRLFVCFCHQGRKFGTAYTDSWTAVSKTPWLYALGLWPSGTTYGGGGRFLTNRKLAIRAGRPLEPHPDHPAAGLEVVNDPAELHASAELVSGADWSGHDHQGHLVFCQDGKLFRQTGGRDVELADFNDREPDPVAAPEWAKRPLGAHLSE